MQVPTSLSLVSGLLVWSTLDTFDSTQLQLFPNAGLCFAPTPPPKKKKEKKEKKTMTTVFKGVKFTLHYLLHFIHFVYLMIKLHCYMYV